MLPSIWKRWNRELWPILQKEMSEGFFFFFYPALSYLFSLPWFSFFFNPQGHWWQHKKKKNWLCLRKVLTCYPSLSSLWVDSRLICYLSWIIFFTIYIHLNLVSFVEISGKDLIKLAESTLSKNIPPFEAKGSSCLILFSPYLSIVTVILLGV